MIESGDGGAKGSNTGDDEEFVKSRYGGGSLGGFCCLACLRGFDSNSAFDEDSSFTGVMA
eukprot:1587048-Pleurochrysis_carterae.AAC.1